MKKFALALATGLGVFVLISASAGSLAARRIDDSSGAAVIRDNRIESSVTATERRLLMLDQALYPETAVTNDTVTDSQLAHRQGERVTADTSTTFTASQLIYRQGERGGAAQPDTTSTDTERLFCDGDICIVP
jgi:hypothetical protein